MCRGLGDDAANVSTSCENYFIPAFREKVLRLNNATLDHRITGRVEGRFADF
jgi:hypothetical protein